MMIKISGLRKDYGSNIAVDRVNLSVRKGEILGLVGPNGAGKTTLLKMISTILEPTDGSIKIFGLDAQKERLKIRKHIGYLPDFFNFYQDLKLYELLYFFAQTYGVAEPERDSKIYKALEDTELLEKQYSFVRNLSRGMTQRIGLATLLVHDPDIFLLDEPASGLDPKARITLRNILKRVAGRGKTIIISSHILTELNDLCSDIAIMNKGKLVLHDRVDTIERKMRGVRMIILEVLSDASKAEKIIRDNSDFTLISRNENIFELEHDGEPALTADLNSTLVRAGVPVISLREEKKNLEDIFMVLTTELKLEV